MNLGIQLPFLLFFIASNSYASDDNIDLSYYNKDDSRYIVKYKPSKNVLFDNSQRLSYTKTQRTMIRVSSIFAGAIIGTASGMYLGGKLASCKEDKESEDLDSEETGCVVVAVAAGLLIGLPLGITGGIHLSTYIISKDKGAALALEYRY